MSCNPDHTATRGGRPQLARRLVYGHRDRLTPEALAGAVNIKPGAITTNNITVISGSGDSMEPRRIFVDNCNSPTLPTGVTTSLGSGSITYDVTAAPNAGRRVVTSGGVGTETSYLTPAFAVVGGWYGVDFMHENNGAIANGNFGLEAIRDDTSAVLAMIAYQSDGNVVIYDGDYVTVKASS